MNVAVIGAGQLGSRHLQGLSKLVQDCTLHIVDPSDSSIAEARKRISEIKLAKPKKVCSHYSPETLPASVELAIIATTSDTRLAAMKSLCSSSSAQFLILEKVLFQNPSHFVEARKLLESQSIKCWVNCPRRANFEYSELRDFFGGEPLTFMAVNGGGWGLGCNAIHFLDLLAFFSGRTEFSFDTSLLDRETRYGKREGFIEISGTLRGDCSGISFALRSAWGGKGRHIISLYSDTKVAVIDEIGSKVWRINEDTSECTDFNVPFQSNLTTSLANSILTDGICDLPTYDESLLVHMPFLKALSKHLGSGDSNGSVPIT